MENTVALLGDRVVGQVTQLIGSESHVDRKGALITANAPTITAATFLAAVMLFLASSGVSHPVRAGEQNLPLFQPFMSSGAVNGSHDYHVTKVNNRQPVHFGLGTSYDDPIAALESYARRTGVATSVPVKPNEPAKKGMIKLAAAEIKPAAADKGAAEAHIVGDKVCLGCHADQAAGFEKTMMGRIGKTQPGLMNCENCHGAGSEHARLGGGRGVGGIISFRSDDRSSSPKDNNAICLGCHEKGHRTLWRGSTHDTRNVACTNCHTVMKNVSRKHQLRAATVDQTCAQCHKDKQAQIWRSSHMPIREGKMTCTDCHNPHGTFNQSMLIETTVNETCYKCHAEKRGPFLFEHAPVRENCLNCHNPHGSNNDFLLKISRPRLCQQCHSGGFHPSNPRNPQSVYAFNRACQNCHSQHHGSNSPSGPRFQR